MNTGLPPGASPHDLPRPGDVVGGKYRIDSVIGAGGMGVVLGAEDISLGRKVAMKFLAPQKADRAGATERFAREARAAASIQSENVVRVFEVGALPNGASYIVMEHLVGADLAHTLLARGPLPVDEAVDYVLQACEAIGEAHGRGIVHRDLKPQNLFLAQLPDGASCVKVLDFGISKAVTPEAQSLTATNTVMGTPLYMSPEQVRSLRDVDHRSDIWALGAILFEFLTASPIYEAATTTALCAMIAMDPPIPLRAKRADAPPALEALILRCLHKDPSGRFQDVGLLAEALAPFASERGRLSAAKVARVVRAGARQGGFASASSAGAAMLPYGTTSDASSPPHALSAPGALPMTAGVGSSLPPGAMPGAPASPSFVPHGVPHGAPTTRSVIPDGVPTTQQSWHHPAANPGATHGGERRSSAPLVALLGAGAAVVVLSVLAGGGYLLYSAKQRALEARASASASAAVVEAAGAAPLAPVVGSAPVAATTSAAPAVLAAKKPDGGAATAQKDAGAGVKPKTEDDLEAAKRLAAGECAHMQFLLRTNDAKNNDQAKTVKNLMCLRASGPQGVTCQRAACRSACSVLQDKSCLFQLDNAERNFPPRF